MKFRVIGANRETGARMTLEFEADSKAAAERKASQSGMSVNRVENVDDGYANRADIAASSRREHDGSFGLLLRFLILIAIALAAFWWFYLRKSHGKLPGM